VTAWMTSRQRIITALKCQEPDRIPFLESVVDERIALALLGKPVPVNFMGGELGVSEKSILTGVLLGSENYDPLELVVNLGMDGFGTYLFIRHEGIQQKVGDHYMVHGGRIHSRSDLTRIILPDPNDPDLYEPFRQFISRYRASDRALFCFTNLGSDPVILGMGFETFSTMIYDDRGLLEDLFDIYCNWQAQAVSNLCKLDFDFLWFGDDIAFKTGPYVSPKIFKDLFMPHYLKVAQHISKPWIFHSDGNLMSILDELLSLGMAGLHPIEPEAMDIGEIKKRYGNHLCLVGNIDVDLLSRGSPSQVDRWVSDSIIKAGMGGGYIAGSSNSIPFYAQPENVRAMQYAILKYGEYPLSR
jgi:uroporphyrinogen decarboxylase